MLLFDHDTGKTVEVPDEQVTEAIKSGRYTAQTGAQIPVVNTATGEAGSIAAEEAYKLFNEDSFAFETGTQRTERKAQEKYGEGLGAEAAAAGLGALRGASLGLSDVLIEGLGGEDAAKAVDEYRKRNPYASTGGEIAGAVAPAILTGAGGAVGTAARLTPAGATARAGLAAERGAAALLGTGAKSAAGRIVQSIVPKAAGSAIEGAVYGAGAAISEAALGDTELTAENLLSNVGWGALIGGGSAAALSGAGLAARGSLKLAAKGAKGTAEAIESLYENATGKKAAPGLGKLWAKASGVVSGADDDVLGTYFGGPASKQMRQRAVQPESVLDDYSQRLRQNYDDLLKHANAVTPESLGNAKLKGIGKVIKRGNENLVASTASYQLEEIGMQLDEMIKAGQGEYTTAGLKALRAKVKAHSKRVMANFDADDANEQIFMVMDTAKRDIGKHVQKLRRSTMKDSAWRQTYEALRDSEGGVYRNLKTHLENEQLYGDAAQIQQAINAKWTNHLGQENYRNSFAVKMGSDNFDDVYVANDTKFRSFVRDLTSTDSNDYRYITHHVRSKKELIDEIAKHYDLDDQVRKSVQESGKAAEDFMKALNEAQTDVVAINQLRELEQLSSAKVLGAAGGAGIGYLVGEEEGALVGAVLGGLARPGQAIRQLATLERINKSAGGKIKAAVRGMLRAGQGTGKAASETAEQTVFTEYMSRARRATAPVSVKTVQLGEKRKDERSRAAAFKNRRAELAELITNPDLASRRVTEALLPLQDAAPETTRALADKTIGAAQFLYEKMPKPPPSVEQSLTPKAWRPTEAEIVRWERYLRAVEDPQSVLRNLSRGTISQEEVETMQTIYPKLHLGVVEALNENLAELQRELPRKTRTQLSLWFGVPVDATLTPDFISMIQQIHIAEEIAQEPQGHKGANGLPRKFESEMPGKYETEAQRVEAR